MLRGTSNPTGQPTPRRRSIAVLVLRLGIGGVFIAGLGISVVSFTLFGCYCWNGYKPGVQLEPYQQMHDAAEVKGPDGPVGETKVAAPSRP